MGLVCKLAGIVCILAACLMAGLELERGLKRRWLVLREMGELLEFLEKEMVFHRTPLREALGEAAGRSRTELGGLFERAAAMTEPGGGASFSDIWGKAAEQSGLGRLLTEEEYRMVWEVSAALCNADTVMQKTLMDKYRDRFAAMSCEMEKAYREKGALYRKLAVSAGVFLAILLI